MAVGGPPAAGRTGPLGPGLDAYARGLGEASRVARSRLEDAADDFTAAQLLARASVQLGRDASALSLFDRLGPDSLTADDFYLWGSPCPARATARRASRSGSKGCRPIRITRRPLRADPGVPRRRPVPRRGRGRPPPGRSIPIGGLAPMP